MSTESLTSLWGEREGQAGCTGVRTKAANLQAFSLPGFYLREECIYKKRYIEEERS